MTRLRRLARLLNLLAVCGLLSPLPSRVLPQQGSAAWLVDLLTHWQLLYLPLALLGALAGWHCRARWAALTGAAAVALGVGLVTLPASTPRAADTAGAGLRLLTANVHLDTTDPAPLLDWARAQRVDVLVLQEVSPAYAQALAAQAADFPYRRLLPSDDPFGLAIISRLPFANSGVHAGPDGIPWLRADLQMGASRVPVIAAHPFPPLNPAAHQARATLLRQLDALAAAEPALIVAGDLNASPWSAAFSGLDTLHLASRALPSWYGVLPIDHVLTGPRWQLGSAARAPRGQSDHHPILVDLRPAPGA